MQALGPDSIFNTPSIPVFCLFLRDSRLISSNFAAILVCCHLSAKMMSLHSMIVTTCDWLWR